MIRIRIEIPGEGALVTVLTALALHEVDSAASIAQLLVRG